MLFKNKIQLVVDNNIPEYSLDFKEGKIVRIKEYPEVTEISLKELMELCNF